MAELFDRKVGCKTSLTAFFPDDSDTDVSCLNHRDIVSAISNAANTFLRIFTDEFRNVGFLSG
jgi:hypothetical protein